MKKLVLATAILTTLSFSTLASTSTAKAEVEQLVTNAQIIQQNVTKLATELTVKSVVLSTHSIIEYVPKIDSLLKEENVDDKKIEAAFAHLKELTILLDESWKAYQARNDPMKKNILSSYQLNEKTVQELLAASKLLEVDDKT